MQSNFIFVLSFRHRRGETLVNIYIIDKKLFSEESGFAKRHLSVHLRRKQSYLKPQINNGSTIVCIFLVLTVLSIQFFYNFTVSNSWYSHYVYFQVFSFSATTLYETVRNGCSQLSIRYLSSPLWQWQNWGCIRSTLLICQSCSEVTWAVFKYFLVFGATFCFLSIMLCFFGIFGQLATENNPLGAINRALNTNGWRVERETNDRLKRGWTALYKIEVRISFYFCKKRNFHFCERKWLSLIRINSKMRNRSTYRKTFRDFFHEQVLKILQNVFLALKRMRV